MTTSTIDSKAICVRATQIMADGSFEGFETVVHPDARNREDVDEPPASRGGVPLPATSLRCGCGTPTPT